MEPGVRWMTSERPRTTSATGAPGVRFLLMPFVVVGAGAIGAVVGGRLHRAGHEVT